MQEFDQSVYEGKIQSNLTPCFNYLDSNKKVNMLFICM